MRILACAVAFALQLPAMPSTADVDHFIARVHTSPSGTMPYRLFVPNGYVSTISYPLVIWLHGAGGSGEDNLLQISGDQIAGTRTWTSASQQAKHPAFVLVPQSAEAWDTADASPDLRTPLRLVLEILDALSSEFTIDQRRVYVLGQSVGGNAVWNLISNAPDRFAAAVMLCPMPPNVERAGAASAVPLWLFQGGQDWMVKESKSLISTVRKAGAKPRYTEYSGMGHDIWLRVFKERELPDWLFKQTRGRV